jgi:polygalacturonase
VNSPWDDGICPKSSYALGYARPTENLTITNCFVTGDYQLGSVLDGTWKPMPPEFKYHSTGRIKCGTESNGGFINVTISNCVFNHCRGFALETVDGARCEDMTFMGITMRDIRNSPMFLRLGTRMRGPKDAKPGTLKRVILSNITCHDALLLPSIISGVPDLNIEDIQVNNVYLHQIGGGSSEIADRMPPEGADKYPEPRMFGDLPATGFFIRHVRNLEMSNVEIACETPDARPAFWLQDVQGADFFRLRVPGNRRSFALKSVKNFRTFGSQFLPDVSEAQVASRNL